MTLSIEGKILGSKEYRDSEHITCARMRSVYNAGKPEAERADKHTVFKVLQDMVDAGVLAKVGGGYRRTAPNCDRLRHAAWV